VIGTFLQVAPVYSALLLILPVRLVFLQGVEYVVDGNQCRVRPAPQIMNQMCLPGKILPVIIGKILPALLVSASSVLMMFIIRLRARKL